MAGPGDGFVVLVVDDDRHVRRALKAFLETKGFEVHVAADLSQALGVIGVRKVDVALIDLLMPGSSPGTRVVEVVGRWFPTVKRVLMTGNLSMEAELDAALLGVKIFAKNVFLNELVQILLDAIHDDW